MRIKKKKNRKECGMWENKREGRAKEYGLKMGTEKLKNEVGGTLKKNEKCKTKKNVSLKVCAMWEIKNVE